ncbi:MAG TPA: hypothetical protein VHP37_05875 [Burkholderiales bacterium]|nr:hypothetical protein [Burkholderiales bacterium]
MELAIPLPLTLEHEELHEQLRKATRESGAVGEAARAVAKVLHPRMRARIEPLSKENT